MDEVAINTSKTLTLTLPSDPASNLVSVSLYHEYGDLVSGPTSAVRTASGVYTITYGQEASGIYILNSSGRHRADFKYTISGVEYVQSKYINVFTPYITAEEFFEAHPELELEFASSFDSSSKRVKNIIDTYCGQSFDFYPNKSIYVSGNGYVSMKIPMPISDLTSVIQDPGTVDEYVLLSDTVSNVEKIKDFNNFDTGYGLKFKKTSTPEMIYRLGKWNKDSTYKITGSFGWRYVPDNVKQAADILLADLFNHDSEYRSHSMTRVEMDAITMYMSKNFYETTGNVEADVLLMDYTLLTMDYIV